MKRLDWFDPRAAVWGAALMGSVAALINAVHGGFAAAVAGGKQALYTFFFAGLIMQLCTRLASRPGPRRRVLAEAIGIPFAVTFGLISLVHGLRGTAEPVLTIGAVLLMGLPSFTLWAIKTRDGVESAADDAGP
jgi:hypothetical protein